MKIFVTGATGLVGSHLVRRLMAEGHQVTILRRTTSDLRGLAGLKPREVVGDVLDREILRQGMRGVDRVFHLAGVISYSPQRAAETFRVNVEGVRAVVDAAREVGIGRLVHMSSIVAIGQGERDRPISEAEPYNLGEMPMSYFVAKKQGEDVALGGSRDGLDVVVVNPGSILGPHDYKLNGSSYVYLIARRKLRWLLSGGTNFVDVDDVVEGTLLAAQKGRSGERYILGGENLLLSDFVTRVSRAIGLEPPTRYVPWYVHGGVVASLRLTEALGIYRRMSADLVKRVTELYMFYDISKAQSELGYRPRPIESAVERTYAWLRDVRLI